MTSLHLGIRAATSSLFVNDFCGLIRCTRAFLVALCFGHEPLIAAQFPVSQSHGRYQGYGANKEPAKEPVGGVVTFVCCCDSCVNAAGKPDENKSGEEPHDQLVVATHR